MTSLLPNPIDVRMSIRQHSVSGFHSITHTARQYNNLRIGHAGIQCNNWLRLGHTNALMIIARAKYSLHEVVIRYQNEVFVHPALHLQFMYWIDKEYFLTMSDRILGMHDDP